MKTKLIIFTLLTTFITTVSAVLVMSFPGWDWLTEHSNDIIVVRCSETPPPTSDDDGVIYSKVNVISILKGVTNSISSEKPKLGPAIVRSLYWPRQSEYYLIFASYHEGSYQAIEDYRVIPLGVNFSTNSIAGKPLDEQMQILFQQSVNHLNREIQKDQEEKQRLEEGLKQ